ncbi:hypothetical protein Emag_000890 [Eimeria magna]
MEAVTKNRLLTRCTDSRARLPGRRIAASMKQHTSRASLRGGGHMCRSVFVCVLLAVVVLGQPAASSLPMPPSFHRGDRERADALYWPPPSSALAESHVDLGAPVAAGLSAGSQEVRGSVAEDKGERGSHPGVVDPFSAAQVLSAGAYKKHLLAQVHLHKGIGLSDEGRGFVRSAETGPSLSEDIKKASSKVGLKDGKLQQGLRFSMGGESLLELAKEEREETANPKDEEEAQLLLPASYASRDVAPHWPLFADDFSDLNDKDEENMQEQQQQMHGLALPPKERQAASLVEAASSAEEEGGDSQAEEQPKAGSEAEEQEGESEGTDGDEKLESSKKEKQESGSEEAGSSEGTSKDGKHESGAGEEGSEAEGSETETSKNVSNKKKHEGGAEEEGESGSSDEAAENKEGHDANKVDKGDTGDTEGSNQEEAAKQSSEAKDVETSAAEETSSAREEENSKEDEASKQEGASKKEAASMQEAHASESAAEASEKEKPETETPSAAHGGGKKKDHEEHEETHRDSESKGSSSKEEQPSEAESTTVAGSEAAATTLALPETKEKQEPVKQEQQKQQKAAETPHEKTEEEKAEEHRMHMKQLAEKATKLANIQRMEQDALLKLHMLGEGGPRVNAPPPSGTSSMSVQDQQQHRQLEEATKTAESLTSHLRVQHELKKREMALKQKEIAHLNLLKHLQVVMQSAVSTVWTKLTGLFASAKQYTSPAVLRAGLWTQVQASLKRLVQQSTYVNKRFLRETDNRVLRPQELPKARYDLVAGGGGFRTCAPFTDEATAACPESYTRCAMAAPVRGRQYELLASVASPGEYKLCMLQFWMPPDKLKGDVIVLGVDEIGSVKVQDVQAARRPANVAQAETAAAAAEKETAALEVMQPLPLHKPGELEEKETETSASKEEKLSVDNEVPSTIKLHPSPPKA